MRCCKIFCLAIACLLFGAVYPLMAQNPPPPSTVFHIDAEPIQPGDQTVDVFVRLADIQTPPENTKGITGLQFRLKYDGTKLSATPDAVSKTVLTQNWLLVSNLTDSQTPGFKELLVVMAHLTPVTADGPVVGITFNVLPAFTAGTTALEVIPLRGLLINPRAGVAVVDGPGTVIKLLVSGTVTLASGGIPTWTYTLTHSNGEIYSWTYNGALITGAEVTGTALDNGWTVASQTEKSVRFTTSTPLTSGSVTGFKITGSAGGLGAWTCGGSSGLLDGPVPVDLSLFTAALVTDGVQLKWRTESETNNLGFNVYRSTSKGGDFVKINPTLIKGHGTDGTPYDYTFLDETAQIGSTYFYQIEDVDFSGNTNRSNIIKFTVGKQIRVNPIPKVTALMQNYPNPFNPETWIPYQLSEEANVTLTIYDMVGQVVRTIEVGHQQAAIYVSRDKAIYWDGRNDVGEQVSSSIYFYHLQAGDFYATRKMTILK